MTHFHTLLAHLPVASGHFSGVGGFPAPREQRDPGQRVGLGEGGVQQDRCLLSVCPSATTAYPRGES